MKRKRIIIIVGSIIGLAIIALAIAKKNNALGDSNYIKVEVQKVSRKTITETITATGKITPETEVKLSPDVSGEIVELYVEEGDEIEKGKLIAKINPEIYKSNYDRTVAGLNTSKANLANSNARLEQVKAQLINTEIIYNRNKGLFEKDAISQAEYETSLVNYQVAKAEVNAAQENVKASEFNVLSSQAVVDEAKENLSKTSIYSPVSGTISKLNVQKGERVAGASQFSAGTEILRIANLQEMEVIVEVNENDIARISKNDTAIVEVDAYINQKIIGIVNEIAVSANTQGTATDQITNFEVKIKLLPESYKNITSNKTSLDSPLRPGMSANVSIQTLKENQVVAVPIQAVTTRNKKDFSNSENTDKSSLDNVDDTELIECVFVYKDNTAVITKVKTGIQDTENIHIIEGLNENDEIIISPYRIVTKTLKNGDKVKSVAASELIKSNKKESK